SVHWSAWLAGSFLGALPMVPWLVIAIGFAQNFYGMHQYNPLGLLLGFSVQIYLFIRHWLSLSLGLDLRYSLGDDFAAFLEYPTIGHTRLSWSFPFLRCHSHLLNHSRPTCFSNIWSTSPYGRIDLLPPI